MLFLSKESNIEYFEKEISTLVPVKYVVLADHILLSTKNDEIPQEVVFSNLSLFFFFPPGKFFFLKTLKNLEVKYCKPSKNII